MSEPFFGTLTRKVAYDVVRNIIWGFCRVYWRASVEGSDRIPAQGPFILAPVHRSNIDTPLVCGVTGRRMRYLGKKEMWKYWWSAAFFSGLGGIPVDRGEPDRHAMREAQQVLEVGEPLIVFPEGTRQSGPIVQSVFDGVAFLALRAGVPIVPVGIGGSEGAMPKGAKWLRPVKVHLVVGEPIPVAKPEGRVPRRAVHELTERLVAELQAVFDDAQVVAGA